MMRWLIVLSMLWPLNVFAAKFDKELHCLSLNIYHEARGESTQGQLAVAYVTMNRVVSGRYPDSICDVVWQDKQFSWTHDTVSDMPVNKRQWQSAKRVAAFVYRNYYHFQRVTKGAADFTRGALYFYAPTKAQPDWARKKMVTLRLGAHLFLKDRNT